jgi:hypothetical protein
MTNPNLSQGQFGAGSHNEVIDALQERHGVNFTSQGLGHTDESGERRVTPIANIHAIREEGFFPGDPDEHLMHFAFPTEDPDVNNTMMLSHPTSEEIPSVFRRPTGVQTTEEHHYPDSGKSAFRLANHKSVSDAVSFMRQGEEERARHQEKGTVPSDFSLSMNVPMDDSMRGKWVTNPTYTPDDDPIPVRGEDDMTPPSTINYQSLSEDGDERYSVHTDSRNRIWDN